MSLESILLDTSFILRLLKRDDPLCENAEIYFRAFLNKQIPMFFSTISIAEYCVRGSYNELPMRNLQVLPFNTHHAIKAGEFMSEIFRVRETQRAELSNRAVVINDTKLFAQADSESFISHYITSDSKSAKVYNLLANVIPIRFTFIDLKTPPGEFFGEFIF